MQKLEVKINKNQDVQLIVYTHESFLLEKSSFMEKKVFFEEITVKSLQLVLLIFG